MERKTIKIKLTQSVIHALCQQWRNCTGGVTLHCLTEASAVIVGNVADATDTRDIEDKDIKIFLNMVDIGHIKID